MWQVMKFPFLTVGITTLAQESVSPLQACQGGFYFWLPVCFSSNEKKQARRTHTHTHRHKMGASITWATESTCVYLMEGNKKKIGMI